MTEQVEQGAFKRGDRVNGGAQVKGLVTTPAAVTIGVSSTYLIQNPVVLADGLSHNQSLCVFKRLPDFLAAWHFTNPVATRVVFKYHHVTGEKWAMCTTEVKQHVIATSHGDDLHLCHTGGVLLGKFSHHTTAIGWCREVSRQSGLAGSQAIAAIGQMGA